MADICQPHDLLFRGAFGNPLETATALFRNSRSCCSPWAGSLVPGQAQLRFEEGRGST